MDIIVGQDNLWKFVLEDTIIHPSEKFAVTNTKLGWTLGGHLPTHFPVMWQQNGPEGQKISINAIRIHKNSNVENNKIEEVLLKLFNKEEEKKDESIYTPEEKYAVESFLKNIKQEKDGRYTVNPLLKPNHLKLEIIIS